jgi:hypothetical protein
LKLLTKKPPNTIDGYISNAICLESGFENDKYKPYQITRIHFLIIKIKSFKIEINTVDISDKDITQSTICYQKIEVPTSKW